ncbi:MAG: hypothetical protein KGI75_03400 [Rhizobiaceae bacterium]|nr:hypothetical protein [Rhizobiaceae bacterium]
MKIIAWNNSVFETKISTDFEYSFFVCVIGDHLLASGIYRESSMLFVAVF